MSKNCSRRKAVPLFMVFTLLGNMAIPTFGSGIQAHKQDTAGVASPAFQVATIKPSKPEEQLSIVVRGRRFVTTATSVRDLIMYAFGVQAQQITDRPDWLTTQKFDLVAEPDTEASLDSGQMKRMVQNLLADRFEFAFHRDKRQLSVYAIVVGNGGPKLTKSASDPNGVAGVGFNGPGKMTVRNATIADFANLLQRYVLDRPVLDHSGISGKYDLTLNWTPDESQFGSKAPQPADNHDELPNLYTAIQEQLGLRLKSVKGLTEILVVDHVSNPSDN